MEQLLKITTNKTGGKILDVKFDDSPGQTLNFEVIVRMDSRNLSGELTQEKYTMLTALYGHLGLVLESHRRTHLNH